MEVPAAGVFAGRLLGGRFRLESVLGVGGMATVYRATDESLGRPVAVKLFDSSNYDPARQESELAVLSSLDHHGVVNLFDAGVDTDDFGRTRRYLVMALITGQNLHDRIEVSPIASRHIAEIGYDMAEALEYIHSHNVLHRDIKPSNILLVDYGNDAPRARAKLTDFGIALFDDIERMTAEGETMGTAAYLSPEQVGGKHLTPASDVYSLGLVLLQSFTRSIEFPGSMVESAMARLSRDPVIPDFLPPHWRDVLTAMTSSDPAMRPVGRELVALLRQTVIADSARHKDAESDTFYPTELAGPEDRSAILDTIPDEAMNRVAAMAARLFSAPIAIVSVIDHDRNWFQTYYAPEVTPLARDVDLRGATIAQLEPVIIEDASSDPRSQNSSLVTGPLGLRFYVGVPLTRRDGEMIGTLSVLDFIPRLVTPSDVENLTDLGALVIAQLETRHEGLRTVEMTGPMMALVSTSESPSPR